MVTKPTFVYVVHFDFTVDSAVICAKWAGRFKNAN